MMPSIYGYIFAGGKSSRMGLDKASLILEGKTLAERAVDRMALAASDVHLCGWNGGVDAPAPVLADAMEDAGPLAALVSALEDADRKNPSSLALVLAVDLPLLPWELLQWLILRAQLTHSWATIPVMDARPQPLCAVYSSALAPQMRAALLAGERKLTRAIEAACPPQHFDKFVLADVLPAERRDALPVWFMNVNTPADLAAAQQAYRAPRVW
jgi:molybdopterin-guanine dinucleotide biosynthesis protein A